MDKIFVPNINVEYTIEELKVEAQAMIAMMVDEAGYNKESLTTKMVAENIADVVDAPHGINEVGMSAIQNALDSYWHEHCHKCGSEDLETYVSKRVRKCCKCGADVPMSDEHWNELQEMHGE